MARSARRRAHPPAQAAQALVLDAHGLTQAAAGDPYVAAWVARTRELQLPLAVNPVTVTETVRGAGRDASIHLLTRNAHLEPVDADLAADAGRLLGYTGRDDTVDALVATTAIRLNRPVTILTSDPADLTALTADHPDIRVVGI